MTLDLNLDWLISVDDHILEPPNLWVDRVAAKDRDRAPHMEIDRRDGLLGVRRQTFPELRSERGGREVEGGVQPRAAALLRDAPGLLRPQGPARGHGPGRDPGLAVLPDPHRGSAASCSWRRATGSSGSMPAAYNDWMVEEWCGAAPGRYIPLMLIPMWDPPLAAKEMERMAAKGVTAFAFSENPAPLGLPTIHDTDRYWDPVMSTANELEHGRLHARRLVVTGPADRAGRAVHGQPGLGGHPHLRSDAVLALQRDVPAASRTSRSPCPRARSAGCPTSSSGPSRSSTSSATGCMRGRAVHGSRHDATSTSTPQRPGLFREHVFGCFIEDHHGIASIDEIGEDNIMCETDYPHSDSTWPNCITAVKKVISHLPPETQYKILRGQRRAALPLHPGRAAAPAGA